eukprot:NODE_630_length_1314_cov_101.266217_g591_i0.p1 GENE.NODE_630_length_1314_cov_101.266217_g591_i0~~NODE_630_length_1314_cov_101.266217_g591_i0.p1  ORF type:complete len:390 (+),score=68.95 NODE_630_length_1314_cov_101.266217_g591_i0:65-1171(+)
MPRMAYGDEDDPFMQGASYGGVDDADPFDLSADNDECRRSLLPPHLLCAVLSFARPDTISAATCVNRFWHEAAESDDVWKPLCLSRYDEDNIYDNKRYCQQVGWKLIYHVGICKTILVNTPQRHTISLMSYAGLTVRDLLRSIGVDEYRHVRVSSSSFNEDWQEELEDMDEDAPCPSALAHSVLCHILVDACSQISVSHAQPKARGSGSHRKLTVAQLEGSDEDEEEASTARQSAQQQADNAVKKEWETRAKKRLAAMPPFVWKGMRSNGHWSSLDPSGARTRKAAPAAAPTAAVPSKGTATRGGYTASAVPSRSTPGSSSGAHPRSAASRGTTGGGSAAPPNTARMGSAAGRPTSGTGAGTTTRRVR